MTDFNTGGFTAMLDPGRTIAVHSRSVCVRRAVYADVQMAEFITQLTARLRPRDPTTLDGRHATGTMDPQQQAPFMPQGDTLVSQRRYFQRLQHFLKAGDIVLAEAGTSLFGASSLLLPDQTTFIGQVLWSSIGYTLGAMVGACIAAPDRRVILLIGDGAFQLTAQELSTAIRHGVRPIVLLVNNDGYTVERLIHGPKMPYNDIQRWRYHALPHIFGDGVWTAKVSTETELNQVLPTAEKVQKNRMALVEVIMPRMDCPEILRHVAKQAAALNR